MLLAIPVILSWRHVTFRDDLSAANQRFALPRAVCAQQFLWFLSDLPFVLIGEYFVMLVEICVLVCAFRREALRLDDF